MEIHRLRQFRVVVETSNLRKAADLLGLSHSGLSKSMKVLENELSMVLFHPSGRGVVISDQGLRLYERSQRFLDEYKLLIDRETAATTRIVRIGSFEVFTSYFIGLLLKNYLPGSEAEIHELYLVALKKRSRLSAWTSESRMSLFLAKGLNTLKPQAL